VSNPCLVSRRFFCALRRQGSGVTFNLEGDSNDGKCDLFVDRILYATLDMYDSGHNRVLVIVRGLPETIHNLLVDDTGYSTHGGYGDDIAVFGGTAVDSAPTLDVNPNPLVAGQIGTFTVTDAKANTNTFLKTSKQPHSALLSGFRAVALRCRVKP